MTSPLFEDKPLDDQFRLGAECTWAQALAEAEQQLEDSMPLHAGSIWNTGHLWESAYEQVLTDPVRAAALLVVLSEHSKLLQGSVPRS